LTIALILIIGLAWLVFLGPTILRARNRQGRSDSVGDFHHRLTQLGRTNGRHRDHPNRPARMSMQRPLYGPRPSTRPMTPTQKRRRDVLLVLCGLVAVTLLATVALRSTPVLLLNVLADAALIAYVFMLVQVKRRAREERAKVRFLGSAYRAPAAYLVDVPDHVGSSESSGPRLVPLRQTASR
jgi:hypothetical protein